MACLAALAGAASADAQTPPTAPWPVAGRQGIMSFVIVPMAQARDRDAYADQIKLLCKPQETCFLNFYTNSSGAELGMPLPDGVMHEATAVFRRSPKQGTEGFRWSCRMGREEGNCF